MVVAAIRTQLENSSSDQTAPALRQLKALEKSLPTGKLQVDVSFAAERLALFRLDASLGRPTASDAKDFARHLDIISKDCAVG